jgi:hypothetical protein
VDIWNLILVEDRLKKIIYRAADFLKTIGVESDGVQLFDP